MQSIQDSLNESQIFIEIMTILDTGDHVTNSTHSVGKYNVGLKLVGHYVGLGNHVVYLVIPVEIVVLREVPFHTCNLFSLCMFTHNITLLL